MDLTSISLLITVLLVVLLGSGVWIAIALLAPWLAPFNPNESLVPMAMPGERLADGRTLWLGADHLGRDILSRIIWGGRTVLVFAPLATACAYAVGVSAGRVFAKTTDSTVQVTNSSASEVRPDLPLSSRIVRASGGSAGTHDGLARLVSTM